MDRFVLIDRDGVINRRIVGGYVTTWEEFQFLPRVFEAMAMLARHSVRTIVVSNQAGVGKGLLSPTNLEVITQAFVKEIEEHGGRVGGVYYCPHRPEDGCECRKPKPGLILRAQREHGFCLRETYLIGDSPSDLAAAQAADCPALLIAADEKMPIEQYPYPFRGVFLSLAEAARFVISHSIRSDHTSNATDAP